MVGNRKGNHLYYFLIRGNLLISVYKKFQYSSDECKNVKFILEAIQKLGEPFWFGGDSERSLWSCISYGCMELSSSTQFITYDRCRGSWKLCDFETLRGSFEYSKIFVRDYSEVLRHGTWICCFTQNTQQFMNRNIKEILVEKLSCNKSVYNFYFKL